MRTAVNSWIFYRSVEIVRCYRYSRASVAVPLSLLVISRSSSADYCKNLLGTVIYRSICSQSRSVEGFRRDVSCFAKLPSGPT